MKEEFYICGIDREYKPTRRQRKRKKKKDLSLYQAWHGFMHLSFACLGCPGMGLYSSIKGLLAYSFERPEFPSGDEFDRMRIRVTGAMPRQMKAKIIEEFKSGHFERFWF